MVRPRSFVVGVAVAAATALAVVWRAPAALVDVEVSKLTGGRLRVSATQGTVWHGRGDVILGTLAVPVAWRIEPWRLLRGELHLEVRPVGSGRERTPRADLTLAHGRTLLRDVEVALPAAALADAMHTSSAALVGGELRIAAPVLDWAPSEVRGSARLQWHAARLYAAGDATPIDLGDITATLDADGSTLAGPVGNAGGDVALDGRIAVRANDAAALSLMLTPRVAAGPALARALSAIATADEGRWRIDARLPLR